MRVLVSRDGISQNELSEILGVDKGITAVAMKKLTAAGYINRLYKEENRPIRQAELQAVSYRKRHKNWSRDRKAWKRS